MQESGLQHQQQRLKQLLLHGRQRALADNALMAQGSVLVGPGLHFWYGFIGRTVTATGTTGDRLHKIFATMQKM